VPMPYRLLTNSRMAIDVPMERAPMITPKRRRPADKAPWI
jgi:hypothetical protein